MTIFLYVQDFAVGGRFNRAPWKEEKEKNASLTDDVGMVQLKLGRRVR